MYLVVVKRGNGYNIGPTELGESRRHKVQGGNGQDDFQWKIGEDIPPCKKICAANDRGI